MSLRRIKWTQLAQSLPVDYTKTTGMTTNNSWNRKMTCSTQTSVHGLIRFFSLSKSHYALTDVCEAPRSGSRLKCAVGKSEYWIVTFSTSGEKYQPFFHSLILKVKRRCPFCGKWHCHLAWTCLIVLLPLLMMGIFTWHHFLLIILQPRSIWEAYFA